MASTDISVPQDPSAEVRRSRHRMEVESAKPQPDEKELQEREGAAQAYGREDETHFVNYLNDMVKLSRDSMVDIRQEQAECWDVFNEKEPASYQFKEDWQSRTVLPKPNIYVESFLAIISKGFQPQFLSIVNEQNEQLANDIKALMALMLAKSFTNFRINLKDATCMGAAVGQSSELIPMWDPLAGPRWDLIEPWKIHRDPDAISRDAQSGLYWIHQEWLDYHDLKEMADKGFIQNLQQCGPGGSWGNPKGDENIEQNELKRRRDMFFQQSAYRTKVLTSEFYGKILDKRGEVLLDSATYWVVADRVVRLPKRVPYPTLKWPGTSFSPLPHLLRHDGRSLLTGLKSLWYAMNQLMALHIDNLNWTVNPQKKISLRQLVDQEDLDDYPGKIWLTTESMPGQKVVEPIDYRNNTNEIIANIKMLDQIWQVGGPVKPAQQGAPDYRAVKTAREAAQDLAQSDDVMSVTAENIDDGALRSIEALYECIRINITYDQLARWMGPEFAGRYRDDSPRGVNLPSLTTGAFDIGGAATIIKNQEVLSNINKLILPLCDPNGLGQLFRPYMEPKGIIKAIVKRADLDQEGIWVGEEKATQIAQVQQQQQDAEIQAQQAKQASEAQLAGAQAHEVQAEGDRHIAQGEDYAASAAATAAGAGVGGGTPPEPAGYGGEV